MQKKSFSDFKKEKQVQVCFLSNYPPKECGIATFTKDLCNAMDKKFNPKLKSKIVALDNIEDYHNYDSEVIHKIDKQDIDDYIVKAKEINKNPDIKIVSIQHEFGIFGGEYGSYLISFMESVEKPIAVTFHSVLPDPDEERKRIVKAIASRAAVIIVMADTAIEILSAEYGIPKDKIKTIPHGIPSVKYQKNELFKKRLNLNDKTLLITFGLLSRGKGIEYMIKALPPLVEKYPNLLYLVVGETHPIVREEEGEEYRKKLIKLVKDLGLKNHVKFYNKYMTLKEIIEYLLASDIYICTNLEKNQITSGTLAYAFGCGRAVVSTPILYAEEMLRNERGVLAKFKNPKSYTKAIDKILSDPEYRKALEKNAYADSRKMIWQNVAFKYLETFNRITKLREELSEKFPKIKLGHLSNMTDEIGMIQFANHSNPDKNSGYTLDDNSRALIFSILHNKLFNSETSLSLSKTYLNFLELSQEENGNFRNNHLNEEEHTKKYSEDAFGRALWALGFALNNSKDSELKNKAKIIFKKSLKIAKTLNSPRAKSFALCGIAHYYKKHPSEEILELIKYLSEDLVGLFETHSSNNWNWFEPYLTYSNAKLPESLFLAYEITNDKRYLEIGEKSLRFISEIMIIENEVHPIGQNGWYSRGGERAFFDQQPLDVSCLVQSFLTAYKITGNRDYYKKAVIAFNWFLGKNHLKQMIYCENTGGCYDGLGKHSVNLNQGAESTISYLLARIFLEELRKEN